jgi:hypothetical protein
VLTSARRARDADGSHRVQEGFLTSLTWLPSVSAARATDTRRKYIEYSKSRQGLSEKRRGSQVRAAAEYRAAEARFPQRRVSPAVTRGPTLTGLASLRSLSLPLFISRARSVALTISCVLRTLPSPGDSREASFVDSESAKGEGSADEGNAAVKRQTVIDYPKHFPKGKPSTVTTINPKLMRDAGGY